MQVPRLLHRLGLFAAHQKWVVLLGWLVALVLVGALVKSVGANTSNNLELPGTDSQEATDVLAERFPPQQNGKNPIVFHTKTGKVTDSKNKQAIQESFKRMKALPETNSATSPFSQEGAAQISQDKRTAFLTVLLNIGSEDLTEEIAQSYLDAAESARRAGMKVAAGGSIGTELSEPETESSEVVGLTAAMIILALTFGTLVAMGMPIVSAVFGLFVGLSIIGLLGHVTEVPTIAPTLATMIGLGVGIDYALFLVSRYRSEREGGSEIPDAVATAVATSGTAIVFAGGTVVIALVSLLVAGIPLVTSLGYASAFAVITAVAASISLLPAVLSAVGHHIDSFRLPAFLHPKPKPANKGFWAAWARGVTNHPWRAVGASLLLYGVLMIPFLSLNLGQEDIGATEKGTQEREAYDLLANGFGPGYTSPLLVAAELDPPAKPSSTYEKQYARAQSLQDQLEDEQATGQLQAASLQQQADELEAEQASLLAQKASLETKAGNLKGEKAKLTRSSKQLKKQRKLLAQTEALTAEAKAIASEAAALSRQAVQVAAALRERPSRELIQEMKQIRSELRELKEEEAAALKGQFAELRAQASKVGGEAFGLATSAAAAGREAIALVQEKNKLVQQGSQLKVQAAQLQTQKEQLEGLQEQAQTQQQQAEKLKSTLTDELTAAGGDDRGTDTRLVSLQDAMKSTTGVQLVSPPAINKKGNAAVFTVISTTDPADTETADLVKTIREYVIPQSTAGEDVEAHVGGQTASYVDLATAITDKLFLVIFTVIALGFLVLLMAFRSWIVSTQAAVCNLLSVCAAFGVVTACFQFGWGVGLVGIDTPNDDVPIASYVPLIMFAVLFGLSMDYQVFLMSQIEHARASIRGNRRAIAAGLASGARVISAAALIMISVFASFILNGDPTVKQFGVGLSVGVALAGISVLLLAPALLVLAGRGAWWVPRWADRVVPHLDIEGAAAAQPGGDGGGGTEPEPPRKDSMQL
jgi:uncharacterized membrane protein YdfJ with MMPL/SSD domain